MRGPTSIRRGPVLFKLHVAGWPRQSRLGSGLPTKRLQISTRGPRAATNARVMGDYELHFAEEGRAPFGLRLRLPNEWTHKTAQDLVAHFVEAHDKANPPLVGAYGLVDVRTGRFYGDDASLADVAHDAPLSVARRDPPAPPGEENVDAEYALESDEVDAVDDEEPLEDLIAIGAFGGGYQRTRARLRAALRRRRVSVDEIVAESASEEASVASSSLSDEEASDEEDYRRSAPPPQQRKDWGAINYKKALCPDMVAGRKCPHGTACTYAHSYDELRVVEKPGKPHVCRGDSTAAHELAPPEYWQMGTFADASRQGPYLWARLAKAPRHAAVDPSVTYLRRGNQQKMFVTEWVTNVARLRPATQGCPRGVLVAEE